MKAEGASSLLAFMPECSLPLSDHDNMVTMAIPKANVLYIRGEEHIWSRRAGRQVAQSSCGGVTHRAMEKPLGRCPCPIGSDLLKESESVALWRELPLCTVDICEGNEETRLRQNVLVNQSSKMAAIRV